MNPKTEAEIAIETDSTELAAALAELAGSGNTLITKRDGLDGATLTTVLLTITPLVVGQIFRLIRAEIESKKHVRLIYNGVTIQGVSEATLLKIIEQSRGD
ncbi:hypothetical protein LB533_03485 [Mesorhizobium sp. BR1-1-13]|uniref:hypothetical protein n=1 Tax=Mesorhizobium sp. BR1-1-13 TaxID=2876656 RepID=UPI001CD0F258|nr:hypothetical protein [Mesorhizobium sp. BR1-1-13]MBZ9940162.1 hypothetical protein [Mesorhizobium sp. BR1-1-13]